MTPPKIETYFKKVRIAKDYYKSKLLNTEIAYNNKISPASVVGMANLFKEHVDQPEPFNTVVKIHVENIDKVRIVFDEFNIPYEVAEGKFQLIETFESKINETGR